MAARYIVHLARESRIEDRGGDAFPVIVTLEKHVAWGNTWLAEVTGVDSEAPGGFAQTFLEVDSQSLSREGNGTVMYLIEKDGIYQANGVWRSYETHRTVIVVKDGEVKILVESALGDTPAKVRKALHIALTGAPAKRATRKKKEEVLVTV